MDKFQGKIVHSHDYKDYRGYEDKRVVVVGIGNSGGDVTVELSRIASQVKILQFIHSINESFSLFIHEINLHVEIFILLWNIND